MSRVTGKIAQGQFGVHAMTAHIGMSSARLGPEIDRAGFARLRAFVKNQKRISGDIAHELSAPIARIRDFAYLGILAEKGGEAGQLREEIQEMSGLVGELLSFSKAGMDPGGVSFSRRFR